MKNKEMCHRRLARLRHLRCIGAPRWVVKSEQVALTMARKGLCYTGIGATPNQCQDALVSRHVRPLLGVR